LHPEQREREGEGEGEGEEGRKDEGVKKTVGVRRSQYVQEPVHSEPKLFLSWKTSQLTSSICISSVCISS